MAGTNPIRTSVYPNFASGTAIVKSQSVARSRAAGNRSPIHSGNRWLGKVVQRPKQARHCLRIFQALFRTPPNQRLQIVEVHPRAEGFSRTSKNQDLRRRLRHFAQRAEKIVDQVIADRVPLLRTVQRDRRDAAVIRELESGVWSFSA